MMLKFQFCLLCSLGDGEEKADGWMCGRKMEPAACWQHSSHFGVCFWSLKWWGRGGAAGNGFHCFSPARFQL